MGFLHFFVFTPSPRTWAAYGVHRSRGPTWRTSSAGTGNSTSFSGHRNSSCSVINSSSNAGEYKSLAQAIAGDDAALIAGQDVFRSFSGVNRLRLQNVGLTELLGRNVRYTGRMGSDVEPAMRPFRSWSKALIDRPVPPLRGWRAKRSSPNGLS
jgi:hypothetical protein